MAKNARTIIGKLAAKQAQLTLGAAAAVDRAEYHREQIIVAEDAVVLGNKQAAAVEQALDILEKAGVVI